MLDPAREDILRRLAEQPPLEALLTADDLEKQQANAQAALRPAAVLLLVVDHPAGNRSQQPRKQQRGRDDAEEQVA